MIYILFIISLGLTTALILTIRKSQEKQQKYLISEQKLKEENKQLSVNLQKSSVNLQKYSISEKRLKQENDQLSSSLQKYEEIISREDVVKKLDQQIKFLTNQADQFDKQTKQRRKELSANISTLENKLKKLEEQDFIESFGFYESKYNFQESNEYKQRLDKIRAQQKQLIKDRAAAVCHLEWTVNGSTKEGKKMTDNFQKLVLRAFNGECDASVVKVKYNNIHTMRNRIVKSYEDLNKLSQITNVEITNDYLKLKLDELYLTHEYQEKKYQEQEEQRQIREQIREEEKALRELEKAKQEAEREAYRYEEALNKARHEIESATGKTQEKLVRQIEELEQRLAEAEANKERAISQAQLTKIGYIYIISNIGSFGEDIYKIGMTRRLEPMDRVKELGSASVPFPFDVHAMIFCENAPELETRLHRYFDHKRVNKENKRKEFFKVSLEEIVNAVKDIDEELDICRSKITFTKIAEAADYRKTLAQERERQQSFN